jgi:hypothetical protein
MCCAADAEPGALVTGEPVDAMDTDGGGAIKGPQGMS